MENRQPKYLILGDPIVDGATSARYRGTERRVPTYVDSCGDDHEVNRLFFWYLEEGGQGGVVHDLDKALRYAELLHEYALMPFEVVEATTEEFHGAGSQDLLGYDISDRFNASLLAGGLICPKDDGSLSPPIRVLCCFLAEMLGPQINEHGLFSSRESAWRCWEVMNALQHLRPGLYEGTTELGSYRVTAMRLASRSLEDRKHRLAILDLCGT